MTTANDNELDLSRLVMVLARRAWLIALVVAVAFVAAYGLTARQPDRYAATALVQVNDPNGQALASAAAQSKAGADREVATQIERIKLTDVRAGVTERLGAEARHIGSVDVSSVTNTNLLKIRVSSESPETAMEAANAYAEVYVAIRRGEIGSVLTDRAAELRATAEQQNEQIAQIDAQLEGELPKSVVDQLQQERTGLVIQQGQFRQQATQLEVDASTRMSTVTVSELASLPHHPYAPTPLRDAVPVAMVALFFAVALVLLLERLDDKVSAPDQVEELTGGIPVLGLIPAYSTRKKGERKLPHGDRTIVPLDSSAAEAYRTLRTSLRFSNLGQEKQTIAVTSAFGSEGKSTITANLAVTLAESGLGVVLVSADLRRPTISSMFGVSDTDLGLTSVLLGDAKLSESLVNVELVSGKNLYLLPSGPLPHNPAELLGAPAFSKLLRQIEEAGADFVLIDCPPILPVSDPLAIAQHVDGVLVVSVVGRTRRSSLTEAVDRMKQVKADIVGIVLNGVPTRGNRYSYYSRYGYGASGYASAPASTDNPVDGPDTISIQRPSLQRMPPKSAS